MIVGDEARDRRRRLRRRAIFFAVVALAIWFFATQDVDEARIAAADVVLDFAFRVLSWFDDWLG